MGELSDEWLGQKDCRHTQKSGKKVCSATSRRAGESPSWKSRGEVEGSLAVSGWHSQRMLCWKKTRFGS